MSMSVMCWRAHEEAVRFAARSIVAVRVGRMGFGRPSSNVSDGPYAERVASASPSTTPNPDAMKFTLDTTLPEKLDVTSPDAAVGVPFAEAVFAAAGVASIYGVNDFVTVRRQPGYDWAPIVSVVVAAAAAHL
jgi:DUF971 family protein